MKAMYGTVEIDGEPEPGLPDYLIRAHSTPDMLASCDYVGCFADEIEDIVLGTSRELRPIYLDIRHGVMICRDCVAAGKHLDAEPTP